MNNTSKKYKTSRHVLMIVAICTIINSLSVFLGSNYILMMFSAVIPNQLLTLSFLAFTLNTPLAPIILLFAAINLIIYPICFIYSKKHYGWLIAAFAFYSADTVVVVAENIFSKNIFGIVAAVIHIIVMVCLVMGIRNGKKIADYNKSVQ